MMDAFSDDVQRAAIDRIAALFPSGRLIDTSADKVDPDDMEPEVDEGDYLGDLAEEEDDDLGVRSRCRGSSGSTASTSNKEVDPILLDPFLWPFYIWQIEHSKSEAGGAAPLFLQ